MEANFVIFYIENTIDERRSKITAFFPTYDAALEGIKDCADWWRPTIIRWEITACFY